MVVYSCGFDDSKAKYDFSAFNTNQMDLDGFSLSDSVVPLRVKMCYETLSLVEDFSRLFNAYRTFNETIQLNKLSSGAYIIELNNGNNDERIQASSIGLGPLDVQTNGWSTSLWLKINISNCASNACFMSIYDTNRSYSLRRDANTSNIQIISSAAVLTSTGNELNSTNWMHLAATVNNTGNGKIYLNNSVIASGSGLSLVNTVVNIGGYVGARAGGPFNIDFTDGKFKDCRFYNKELTSGEVNSLFNGGRPNTNAIGGELVWLKFDEGTGNTFTDNGSIGFGTWTSINMDSSNWKIEPLFGDVVDMMTFFLDKSPLLELGSVHHTDSISKLTTPKTFTETITETESTIHPLANKNLSESVGLVENYVKEVLKPLNENIYMNDIIIKLTKLHEFLESLNLTDSQVAIRAKALSETINHLDSLVKKTSKVHLESLFVTDTIPRFIRKYLSDLYNLTEQIWKIRIWPPITETITLTDPTVPKLVKPVKLESLSVSDFNIIKDVQKRLNDLIDASDNVKKAISRELTDNVQLNEFTASKLFLMTIMQIIDLKEENVVKQVNKLLTDVISLTETMYKFTDRELTEGITLTEEQRRIINKRIEDILNVDYEISKSTSTTKEESISLAASIVKKALRTLYENLNKTETTVRFDIKKLAQEILNLTGTVTRDLARTMYDYLQLSDIDSGLREENWLYLAQYINPLEFEGGKT